MTPVEKPKSLAEELKRLDKGATAAPWLISAAYDGKVTVAMMRSLNRTVTVEGPNVATAYGQTDYNADLIVFLRNHVPEILQALDRLERAEAALSVLSGCLPDRVYVTDEKWSDSEPEGDDHVTIDFKELLREKG